MLLLTGTSPVAAPLEVRISGLRDAKGVVMLCLTRRNDFLDCKDDPAKVAKIVPASAAGKIYVGRLAPGEWSLLAVHDANKNGKLDTMMGIPREGFGFSRNPALRMGPPHLKDVRFSLAPQGGSEGVAIKYLL